MLRRIITAVAGLMLSCAGAWGTVLTDNFHFTHFKSADGLPHQQIETMAFDHDGRLWVGTRNGLASYDGYAFRTYYHIPGDERSLSHNFVQNLFVDSKGILWISTDNGFCCYNAATDDFERIPIDSRHITAVAETADGSLVCAGNKVYIRPAGSTEFHHTPRQRELYILGMTVSPDDRIFIMTNGSLSYYDARMESGIELSSRLANIPMVGDVGKAPLFFDSRGQLWVSLNGNGVLCMDINSDRMTLYDGSRLTNPSVRAIAEDAEGRIWLGTEEGLNIINPVTGAVTGVTQDLVNPTRLNDNAIYCIVPDRNNNLWIGTYFGGINMLDANYNRFSWIPPGYDSRSLSGKAIRRIVEPVKGELWLASEDGGINIYNIAGGTVRRFDRIPDIGPNVHELYYDTGSGDMWIGTFLNGLYRYNLRTGATRHYLNGESGLRSLSVFSIVKQEYPDGNSRLWISTTQGVRYFDPDNDTFRQIEHTVLDNDFVYSLMLDKAGNLWAGTVNHGLYRMDHATGEIRGWNEADPTDPDGFHDYYITSVLEDTGGRVYVGTNNGGLYYFEPGSLKVKRMDGGMANIGTVCTLALDHTGTVWMTTSNGLFQIDPATSHLHQYTVVDGLPENQFNFNSGFEASDGRMYFGTVNGMVSFAPGLTKKTGESHDVHFSRLTVNGKEMKAGAPGSPLAKSLDTMDELRLDYRQAHQIGIDYGVIDPERAHSVFYQVKVDGIDRAWRDMGKIRRFNAMEMDPGTYRMNVRASSDPENWDNAPIRSLSIKVAPPFYRTAWAYALYLVALAAIGWIIYRLFNVRMRARHSLRMAQIDKAKSDELNREKMEFFTNISHELKTPLSLIVAPLKYIDQHQELSPDAQKRLGVAIANTNKMVGLIDELVTFNRVESGNFQIYLQKGNPLTYIEKLAQYFYEPAEERDISLHVYTENNGEEVWFSTTSVERIVNNLLSNAVKYTRAGGEIEVRASIVEEASADRHAPDQIYLNIEVRDTGIGIAPEERENIFRKYYQTRRGYNTNHHGWGIGLATVKKLVEMHRGSISVDSRVGVGSTFKVRILVTPGAFPQSCYISNASQSNPEPSYRMALNATEQPPALPDYARNSDRVNILLVEDNPELLSFLRETFIRSYNVYTATNGVEALKITSEYPVDIVVSDVMMPEMDGIELCNRLKNDITTSHIPVILLTAKTDEQSTVLGFESGAEAYVPKPFDPQLLELRVKNILRARKKYINSIIGASEPSEENTEEMSAFNKFDKDFLSRINALIEENFDNSHFSISDITDELGISRSLLHIKMKSFTNLSMTEYLRKRRLARALELLQAGHIISETAYRTGFADPNYFTKVFKREYGKTPSEYISELRKAVPREEA